MTLAPNNNPRIHVIPASSDLARFIPNLTARAERAARQLITTAPVMICTTEHAREAPGLCACAQHPGAGLLCFECMNTHLGRHSAELRSTCDECSRVAELIYDYANSFDVRDAATLDRRGRSGTISTWVALFGLVLCRDCYPLPLPVEPA